MKDVNKIKNLKIDSRSPDGGQGWIRIPHVKKDGTKTYKKPVLFIALAEAGSM